MVRQVYCTRRLLRYVCVPAVMLILVGACDSLVDMQPRSSGTLELLRLQISPQRWQELLKSGYLDEWEAVVLLTDTGAVTGRIRIHGSATRIFPKKSFKLALVAPSAPERYGERKTVISGQQPDRSFCRYRLADWFFRRTSLLCPDIRPVELYVNSRYEGLYLEREPVDEHFLRRRGLPLSSLYKPYQGARFSFRHGMLAPNGWSKKVPDNDMSFTDLERLIVEVDRGVKESSLERIGAFLDISGALDYYAVSLLISHHDGIVKNYYLYFNSHHGTFQFIPWDLDLTFRGTPSELPAYDNDLFERLAAVPSCRRYLRARMARVFDLDSALAALHRFAAEVEEAYRRDRFLMVEPGAQEQAVANVEEYLRAMHAVLVEEGIEE